MYGVKSVTNISSVNCHVFFYGMSVDLVWLYTVQKINELSEKLRIIIIIIITVVVVVVVVVVVIVIVLYSTVTVSSTGSHCCSSCL